MCKQGISHIDVFAGCEPVGHIAGMSEEARRDAARRRKALQEFMTARDLKVRPWAQRAGVSANAIYNFLHDRADSLSQKTLEPLARVEGVTTAELMGESLVTVRRPQIRVRVVGAVEAGAWAEAWEWNDEEQYEIMVTRPKGPEIPMFALLVRGPSMNKLYPEGTELICIEALNFHRELRTGDKVIVERRAHNEVEATCKELEVTDDGRAWLWPRSDDPRHQAPIEIPWRNDDLNQDGEIRIAAVVIRSIRDET